MLHYCRLSGEVAFLIITEKYSCMSRTDRPYFMTFSFSLRFISMCSLSKAPSQNVTEQYRVGTLHNLPIFYRVCLTNNKVCFATLVADRKSSFNSFSQVFVEISVEIGGLL